MPAVTDLGFEMAATENESETIPLFHYGDSAHNPEDQSDIPDTQTTLYGVTSASNDGSHFLIQTELQNFDPITLSWIDLWVTATPKRGGFLERHNRAPKLEPKAILKGVTGIAQPGTLTAILGASGAGKSTLLNTLNFRNRENLTMTGHVLVNNRPISKSLARYSAYVQQDDLFLPVLKVREHLIFQAKLRMDQHIPYDKRMQRVEQVLRTLGLKKCADTLIGSQERGIKGISGGERKRLMFASEVLTNPPLMFCDEPTSGLDSFMAQSVVSTLKGLASEGRTILCTIHQPSSEVFAMFDRILLVAEGRTAFIGGIDECIDHFTRLCYVLPKNYNPADFFIETLAIVPGDEETCRQKVESITYAYDYSNNARTTRDTILSNMENMGTISPDHEDNTTKSPYKASWMVQFMACTWRNYINTKREPLLTTVRLFRTLMVSMVMGVLFMNEDINQDGIQNINGCLFTILTNSAFMNTLTAAQVFPTEISLIKREHFDGMYRIDVVFLSKILVELPFQSIFLPAMLMTIVYWMVGLNDEFHRYVTAVVIVILVTNASVSFGWLISSLSDSVAIAYAMAPPLLLPMLLLGGLFVNIDDIPDWLGWVSNLSWFRFAFEALTINQWENIYEIDSISPDKHNIAKRSAFIFAGSNQNSTVSNEIAWRIARYPVYRMVKQFWNHILFNRNI